MESKLMCSCNDSPRAVFIPCMAHSLNFSGNTAAESCVEAVTFFGVVQKLQALRASVLVCVAMECSLLVVELKTTDTHGSVPKRPIETRWSARANALNSLNANYHVYLEVLQQIAGDPLQKKATQVEANSITKALTKLKTGF